jgi:AraC-like DNA-binding protein
MFLQTVNLPALQTNGQADMDAALMDPDIGPALRLIHAQPELPWTVALLADRVCMSRSVFADRFKSMVSLSPIRYLLECRMRKACALLMEERYSIKQIAGMVGYASEAAFNSAFKRWNGVAPGRFRRDALKEIGSNGHGSQNP